MSKQPSLFPDEPKGRSRSAKASTIGYAMRPGTGPAGMTCGQCGRFRRKTFKWKKACSFKCSLVTDDGTRKTDIVKSMPACAAFVPIPDPA